MRNHSRPAYGVRSGRISLYTGSPFSPTTWFPDSPTFGLAHGATAPKKLSGQSKKGLILKRKSGSEKGTNSKETKLKKVSALSRKKHRAQCEILERALTQTATFI